MASLHGPVPASAEQLAEELKNPDTGAIWNRAVEIFGDQPTAHSWMTTPRDLFGGRTPEELVETGDPAQQRRVLEVLIRIDYGVFS
jgi:uncharacterized protein (DUF2384 family)